MRKIIDAHVHLRPEHLCGSVDARTGVRMDPYGKMVFPDGSVYQCMPPYFRDSAFPAPALIATMDAYHVEKAVIMQSLTFAIDEDVAEAVRLYPDRLVGAMIIRPRDESVLAEIEKWHENGLTVIKFEMSDVLGHSHPKGFPEMRFGSPLMTQVFALAGKLGITVTVDPSTIGGPGYQVEELEKAASANPDTRFVLCHLGFARRGLAQDKEQYRRWEEMCALCRHENVWMDVSAMPDLFLAQGWPFREGLDLLQVFLKQYGNEKPIWGSDIPGTLSSATYPEMMAMFERDARLTEKDLNRLFYQNALDAYF